MIIPPDAAARKNAKTKRGFTLTEIAIVLGISGLILGAVWSAAANVYAEQKISKAVAQAMSIVTGMKAAYPNGTIAGGGQNLEPFAISSGMFSPDMIVPCTGLHWAGGGVTCVVSAFQTEFLIGSQTTWWGFTAAANMFEFGTASLTASQCPAFVSQVVQQGIGGGLVNVYTSQTGVKAVDASTAMSIFSGCSGEVAFQFKL